MANWQQKENTGHHRETEGGGYQQHRVPGDAHHKRLHLACEHCITSQEATTVDILPV